MTPFTPYSLRIRGHLLHIERPQVMGIINATPDSFYASSRTQERTAIAARVEQMIAEGADMIDVGAYSSRPGACDVSIAEETDRLCHALDAVRSVAPEIPVSVDTFRSAVAAEAVAHMGANIINDISGGLLDAEMTETVGRLQVPYILMHMRGTPGTMQQLTYYPDGVTAGVIDELSARLESLERTGACDVIIDPGFGFAKTMEQNYRLMREMPLIPEAFHRPLLIGIARKSMLTR
ncbi:MAG: dihydropteroate synthase, partial [Muribaculaceae bacterium]|nr:dihydropteroate synthase [Muribaculaceae bacterium]